MSRILFHAPDHETLAKKVCEGGGIALGEIDWKSFKDGWPDVHFKDAGAIRKADAYFLAGFNGPADVFPQYGIMNALAAYGAKSLTIILPFFPVGQTERLDEPGILATAKTMARLLSAVQETHGSGVPRLVTWDLHATGEQFYFDRHIVVDQRSAMPMFLRRLKAHEKILGEACAIGFPDAGAQKRFGQHFAGRDLVVCDKVRYGDRRIVTIREGNPEGRHVFIIDDMIQTGGTTFECAKVLHARGAKSVNVFATHGVFPNDAHLRFDDALFNECWVTDSCPGIYPRWVDRVVPFSILSLAHEIRAAIFE